MLDAGAPRQRPLLPAGAEHHTCFPLPKEVRRWSPPDRGRNPAPGRSISAVSEVLVSPDGHRVERILVRKSLAGPAKEMLRVKHGSYFVADCATVAEVAHLVDLAALVPEHSQLTDVPCEPLRSTHPMPGATMKRSIPG